MNIDSVFKTLVLQVIEESGFVRNDDEPLQLISIEEAAAICDVSRSVIDSLVEDSKENNFPAVRLSAKTVKVDKTRLIKWIRAGGLINNGAN